MTIMAEAMNKRENKILSSTNEDKEEQGVGDDDKKSPSTDVVSAGTGKRRVRREHSPIVKERAVKGVVTWFNFRKGYGFIHYDDDADDIFVHHSAIARQTRQPLSLHDNQEVEFDIVQGIKGLEAACVSGPDGHRVGTIAMHPFASRSGPGVVTRRRRSEGDHVLVNNDNGQEGKSGGPMKAISNIDAGEKKQAKTGNNGKHKNRPFRRNRANHSPQKDSMDKAGEEPTQETNSQTDESDPKTAVEVEEKHEDESKN